ncbi:MAG: DUF4965 domain-containing protein [Acidobacteriota bacterium]|nr:DUF4965 domain-containing protein [Acidobacteriota bacterium]
MKKFFGAFLFILLAASALPAQTKPFRPPVVPLVLHDPYFSIWSFNDRLTDGPTRHWTGALQRLRSMVRIDGKAFRIMGSDPNQGEDQQTPALDQTGLDVEPTRTIYTFSGTGIRLTLTFLTPALANDLDVLSRPASYIIWSVRSTDGQQHRVALYFDASSRIAVNQPSEPVSWSRFDLDGAPLLRAGSRRQPILAEKGDHVRINWGYLYVLPAPGPGVSTVIADSAAAWDGFLKDGQLPKSDELEPSTHSKPLFPVLAASFDLGEVGGAAVERHLVLAYDEVYSIELLHRWLRPYWRRNNTTAADMLRAALADFPTLEQRSAEFDRELMSDLRHEGGEDYALLSALAYRQTFAATGLAVNINGEPLLFTKENSSNGCISTVDVIYPSSPLFLLLNPRLVEAMMRPVFEYAALPRWKFPFAPHDLGTYPLADGQVYGGGEISEVDQMPVEETGNMLILAAALARAEGNADFTHEYWPLLSRWAGYLKQKGFDPENQLSTDDFAGHLAHNANLSIKAILALRSYAELCQMTGRQKEAEEYRTLAEQDALAWVKKDNDGDHFRLAFDQPGTWSLKYNLVWDSILGFHLLPPSVTREEYAFYLKHLESFGVPLDNRRLYTKLDWQLWTATLAPSPADFQKLADAAYRFADQTPDRVPLSDWYWTNNSKRTGFQARSVVGGLFIKLLADPTIWQKWLHQAGFPQSTPPTTP